MTDPHQIKTVAAVFNRFADQYAERYMDVKRYAQGLEVFSETIAVGSTVLDIGCGPGNVARFLLDQDPRMKLTGIDVSEEMLQIARRVCPEAEFISLDAGQLPFKKKSFGGVVCSFCLPYLDQYRASDLIAHCFEILKPGGVLYVSAIEGDYAHSGPQKSSTNEGPAIHMYFYSESWLHKQAQEIGFQILYSELLVYEDFRGTMVTDAVLVCVKPE